MPPVVQLPARRDLVIRPGAEQVLRFVFEGTDGPFAFGGYGARAMIRKRVADPLVALALTLGSGIALGATDGSVTLTFTAAQCTALAPLFAGVWDLFLDPAGTPDATSFCALRGNVTIDLPVTR